MSSFLRESIVIKSTAEVTLEIHINLFLSQKKYKKVAFEMGIWVKQIDEQVPKQTIQIIFPLTTEKNNDKKNGVEKIEDLSSMFQGKDKDFSRLIFNEELKSNNGILELDGNPISFQKITDESFPSIEVQNVKQGNYYRFRITDIAIDSLIVEQQCSSFIGDPIKRSIKTIGFHINNVRNLGEQNIDDKNEIKNVSFECINTFVVCNMGVDILDSMQEKRSFRALEDREVWGEYLKKCIDKDEISKSIVYQFKKEEKQDDENDENERKKFKNFKLFLRFSETENNKWGSFLTGSTIITLAFITNTLFYLVTNEKIIINGIIIVFILLAALVMFFYTKWKE